jgi:hypothetical protein
VGQVTLGDGVAKVHQVVAGFAHLAVPRPVANHTHFFHQSPPRPGLGDAQRQPPPGLFQPLQAGGHDEGQETAVLHRPGKEGDKLAQYGRLVLAVYLVEMGQCYLKYAH